MEQTHHVLKTELAAGTLPNGKVGVTAASFRLTVLTYTRLSALDRLTRPGDFATAEPTRLRFLLTDSPTLSGRSCPSWWSLLRLPGAVHLALMMAVWHRIAAPAPG